MIGVCRVVLVGCFVVLGVPFPHVVRARYGARGSIDQGRYIAIPEVCSSSPHNVTTVIVRRALLTSIGGHVSQWREKEERNIAAQRRAVRVVYYLYFTLCWRYWPDSHLGEFPTRPIGRLLPDASSP